MGNTKTGNVMTLANSIIGVAILAMPFCFQKCGIILSIVLIVSINVLTRTCCHYLVKSSILCRRKSMEVMASYIFGSSGKLMVELCTIGYLMGTCVAYFVVVGDLGPQIIAKLFDLDHTTTLRTWTMVMVTLLCVLPLGLLKNVDSLSTVCTASIGFYFCLVIKIMSEAKEHLSEGDWLEHVEYWKISGVLQCLPIFSLSLSCQMVIFEIYETMTNGTLEKMNEIVKSAVTICTGVYILVGFFGYVAFCKQPFSGNILLNLEPTFASDVIKIGFVLSVACSFPLVIFPCRASLYSLLYRRGHSEAAYYIPDHRFKLITIALIFFAMVVGILIPSIELIIGLVGSTIGVAICIMFPASCYIKIGKKNSADKLLAQMILVFGFFLMVLGTYANLVAIDEQSSGTPHLLEEPEILKPIGLPVNITDSMEDPRLDGDIQQPNNIVKEIELLETNVLKSDQVEKLEKVIEEVPAASVSAVVKKVAEEVLVNLSGDSESKNNINHEAIMREDREIAIDEQEKSEIKVEIGQLVKTKDLLIKQVQEIKEDLKKQNEVAQNMVLQKFDEIADKVDHIEMVHEKEAAAAKRVDPSLQRALVSETSKSIHDTVLPLADTVLKPITRTELNFDAGGRENPVVNLLIKKNSIAAVKADNPNETAIPEQPSDDTKAEAAMLFALNDRPIQPSIDSVKQPEVIAAPIVVDKNNLPDNVIVEAVTSKASVPAVPYNEKVGRDLLNLIDVHLINSTMRAKRDIVEVENCAETTSKLPKTQAETRAPLIIESKSLTPAKPQLVNTVLEEKDDPAYSRDLKSVLEADAGTGSDL